MRPTALLAQAIFFALLVSACGTTTDPPDPSDSRAQDHPSAADDARGPGEPAEGSSGDGNDDGGSAGGSNDGSGGKGAPGGPAGDADGGDPDRSAGPRGDGGSGDGRSGSGATASGARGVSAPAAGTYVYTQKGFEEFCSTGCERDRLPPRQRIRASLGSRTASSTVVVTKARASGDRLVRTKTRYTDSGAEVLEVHLEYSYEGFDFSRTYRPEPPVKTLRFPLRPGDSWSGRWSGDVSGSYSVDVVSRERFAGGKVVRLDTTTRFRGDLEGRANVTLWVDPADGTVMGTAGNMTVEMGFGTYRTGFATSLHKAS